jgi:hypothetical protein
MWEGFYVKPVRSNQTNYSLNYDPSSNEITYISNPSYTDNQILIGSGTSSISSLPSSLVGQYLQSNGGGLPQWVDLPQPIRLLNQSISSAVVSSWNNGASLTIPANSRFKVEVIIATNYNPAFMIPNPPPWGAFSIALYTSSRYYGVTMGDPTTTANYIYSQCSPINSSGMVIPVKSTALVSDLFDLSTDSATSANICFYFINWDNTNIGALNYSVVITPI